MTAEPTHSPSAARLERAYGAPPELIWELWTTAAGLDQWFAPDGFESRVTELDLRPGGGLRYTMTATAPEQVAFSVDAGGRIQRPSRPARPLTIARWARTGQTRPASPRYRWPAAM
jgi:uncharacterized protein YndB with AHSA1/START domain